MPTIYNLAQIAQDVYADRSVLARNSGIHRLAGQSSARTNSGFFAACYSCGGSTVLAFAGTNDAMDGLTDVLLYSALNSQLPNAVSYLRGLMNGSAVNPRSLTITGHSLGGALAKFAALYLARAGTPAAVTVSFNGPNLRRGAFASGATAIASAVSSMAGAMLTSRSDMPRHAGEGGRILNVRIADDVVSQIGVPMGHTVVLPTPAAARQGLTTYNAHIIATVLNALQSNRTVANADAYRFVASLGATRNWGVSDFF